MKQISKPAIMALVISFAVACNSGETKTESESSDSTATTTTMADNTSQNQDMDALQAAPGLYTLIKDTMGIKVLEVLYKPGDSSAMHSHPDNALYVVEAGKGEFTRKDGSKHVVDFKAGMSMIRGAEAHSVKNVGTTNLKAILVEVNRPNQAANTFDTALNSTRVASKFYKSGQDSLNLRTVKVDYKPGAESALHAHPDLVMHVLSPAKAEFTEKDGTKRVMSLDKGMTEVVPSGTHSVKNVGNTNARVLLVEVNRPAR